MHVTDCSGFLLERPTCWRDTALKHCDKCQRTNHQLQKPRAELHPIPVTKVWYSIWLGRTTTWNKLWEQVHYHAPRLFFQVVWGCPTPIEISRRCSKLTFCRHGWPKVIQSDQGREVCQQVNTRLFQLTDIQHALRISSAYHPQTNGLDERFNQTLVNTLKKVIDSGADDCIFGIIIFLLLFLCLYRISKQVQF